MLRLIHANAVFSEAATSGGNAVASPDDQMEVVQAGVRI